MIEWLRHHRLDPPATLIGAVAAGLAWWAGMAPLGAVFLGWCIHALAYAALLYRTLWLADAETMRRRAAALTGNRLTPLLIAILGAAASVLAIATVLLSYIFVQLRFAQEYAHEYWAREDGLEFPGGDSTPGFSEFVYVALNVGIAMQVSDTTTRSPEMRKLVALHTFVAFLFNSLILATTINLLAGRS